ncbi:hypothetical protein ACOSQ3_014531 [Xanthoceras sorbifolium]
MRLNGAILQIIFHGFISVVHFFLVGTSYDKIRRGYLDKMGGLTIPIPKIFTIFSILFMARNSSSNHLVSTHHLKVRVLDILGYDFIIASLNLYFYHPPSLLASIFSQLRRLELDIIPKKAPSYR